MCVCAHEHQRLELLTAASTATNGDASKYFGDDTESCVCMCVFVGVCICEFVITLFFFFFADRLICCLFLSLLLFPRHILKHTHTLCLTYARLMHSMPYKHPFASLSSTIMFPSLSLCLAFISLSTFALTCRKRFKFHVIFYRSYYRSQIII